MSGVVLGIFVIAAGVLLMLSHAGIVHVDSIWDLWPSIIAALGVVKLFSWPMTGPKLVAALSMIIVGGLLQSQNLGLAHVDMQLIWPVLVILGGMLIVWTSFRHRRHHRTAVSEHQLNKFVVFGGDESVLTTQRFEGGSVTAIFGGVDLDMRQVEMAEDKATLDISAFFGGVGMKVPSHWEVVVHGAPVLGGIDNKTHPRADIPEDAKRTLVVRGSAVLGGIEIKN